MFLLIFAKGDAVVSHILIGTRAVCVGAGDTVSMVAPKVVSSTAKAITEGPGEVGDPCHVVHFVLGDGTLGLRCKSHDRRSFLLNGAMGEVDGLLIIPHGHTTGQKGGGG